MSDLLKVIDDMPMEVYQRLKSAAETGKWEDGSSLSDEQRDSTLQVVMLFQQRRLQQDEHFTIGTDGKVIELSKAELKKRFRGDTIAQFQEKEL
ncbi:YeaC family protein [Shewanella sp. YIC-542]|uniref:YeaC family protein n=1 Tax=Shewanella mytili TaxID=3377111 RepID=UPI00398F363E